MGLFSFIGNAAKSIVTGIAKVARKFADAVLGKMDKKSEQIGRTEKVTKTSSVSVVDNTNEILYSYADEYRVLAKEYEQAALNAVNDYFRGLVNLLEKNEEIKHKIGLLKLKRKQKDITRKISNAITNVVARRISLDDYECRRIISSSSGYNKTNQMKNFCNRVLREANDNLANTVEDVLYEQQDMINSFLDDFVTEKELSLNNMHDTMVKLQKEKEKGDFDSEKMQLLPRLKIELINDALKKLGA